ncbi:hypothetical protein BDE02_05G044500 [Populus trichocarpa]|nr:hypothetical protein BDE02_05G044500 [Populus trichocarpa]
MFLFLLILICLGSWVYCNDRFQRGLKRKPMALIKKLRKASVVYSVFRWLGTEKGGPRW